MIDSFDVEEVVSKPVKKAHKVVPKGFRGDSMLFYQGTCDLMSKGVSQGIAENVVRVSLSNATSLVCTDNVEFIVANEVGEEDTVEAGSAEGCEIKLSNGQFASVSEVSAEEACEVFSYSSDVVEGYGNINGVVVGI